MDRDILQEIDRVRDEARRQIAGTTDAAALEAWRVAYLGRKGKLLSLTRAISSLPADARPEAGRRVNALKKELEDLAADALGRVGRRQASQQNLSFPGRRIETGSLHPLTLVLREMVGIFSSMGFGVALGPDIETDFNNFEALNMPPDHPARDVWDTFFLDRRAGVLLRTHTSPVQVRVMQRMKPPLRIVAVGRCFRRDAFDASHSPVFHQMEGLMVGDGISFAHLKGVLVHFISRFFGPQVSVKFTPSYFPFTEPSAEVSISCVICAGAGCPTCGQTGFLEILGAGMVHPQVFRNVGYDPRKVTGFAFGMGIERSAMIRYGISDIRHFTQNDLRVLRQFS